MQPSYNLILSVCINAISKTKAVFLQPLRKKLALQMLLFQIKFVMFANINTLFLRDFEKTKRIKTASSRSDTRLFAFLRAIRSQCQRDDIMRELALSTTEVSRLAR